jgi:hypothetical protein
MGRVNSWKRIKYADTIGCDSVDGTFVAFGPDVNLPKVKAWLHALEKGEVPPMVMRICPECNAAECLPRKRSCEECWQAARPVMERVRYATARLALVPEAARRTRVPEKDWPSGRRFCAGCQTLVRIADCPPTGSRCSTCTGISSHVSRMKNVYGISNDEWNRLMTLQAGRCAICENPPKTRRLVADHDHGCPDCETGCPKCVRGLLCSRCNDELLGASYHKPEILEAAARYLRMPPMSGHWIHPAVFRGEEKPAPF